jgi:L-cysteine:1D-myo-inositol 2-amino-2-deoxy-alpha-D-glucopyranoside ligase
VRVAGAAASLPTAEAVLAGVRERLADDLDAPGALAVVDGWADDVPGGDQDGTGPASAAAASPAAQLVRDTVDALLGVML